MKTQVFILMLVPALLFAQQKQVLSPQEFKTKLSDKSAIDRCSIYRRIQ